MFDDYKMLRSSGISPFGSALMSAYLFVVAGPIIAMSDWYGKTVVGETGFEFDEDFDGDVEFIEDPPFGPLKLSDKPPIVDDNDDLYGPPTGCQEWVEWVEKGKKI